MSKAGFVGEASIDFADYAEATKASTVSLPLKYSRSKAVLHVSVFLLSLSYLYLLDEIPLETFKSSHETSACHYD